MRLFPPAAPTKMSPPEGLSLGGYDVPGGTDVLVWQIIKNITTIHQAWVQTPSLVLQPYNHKHYQMHFNNLLQNALSKHRNTSEF